MDWGLQQQKLIFSQFWMLKLRSSYQHDWVLVRPLPSLQTTSCLLAVSSQGREGSKRWGMLKFYQVRIPLCGFTEP